ncbi:hypothetical protein [Streptomyces sp. NPDC050982]
MRPHRIRSVLVTAAVVAAAATLSAYGHRLDVLRLKGLGRALPSVCGTG